MRQRRMRRRVRSAAAGSVEPGQWVEGVEKARSGEARDRKASWRARLQREREQEDREARAELPVAAEPLIVTPTEKTVWRLCHGGTEASPSKAARHVCQFHPACHQ